MVVWLRNHIKLDFDMLVVIKSCFRVAKGLVDSLILSTQGSMSRPCVTHSQPHGRVVRPCVPCSLKFQFSKHGSKHMGRDTAMCLSRVEDMASGHGNVPRPREVCTLNVELNSPYSLAHGRVRLFQWAHGLVKPAYYMTSNTGWDTAM